MKQISERMILFIGANNVERRSPLSILSTLIEFINELILECQVVFSDLFQRSDKGQMNNQINELKEILKKLIFIC